MATPPDAVGGIQASLAALRKLDDPAATLSRTYGALPIFGAAWMGVFVQTIGGYAPTRFLTLLAGANPISTESLISTPLWIGASGLVVGAGMGVAHLAGQHKLGQQLNLQDQIRAQFGDEPIDFWLDSSGWGPANKSLRVRWYGGDQQSEENPSQLVNRLDYVALMARRNDIDRITVGTGWIRNVLGDETADTKATNDAEDVLKEFGEVHGRTVWLGKNNVVDLKADPEWLTMEVEQATELASLLRARILSDTAEKLVELIARDSQQSNTVDLYYDYQAAMSKESYETLMQTLRLEIAGILDGETQVTSRRSTFDNGAVRTKVRSHTSTQISGHTAAAVTTGRDPETGTVFTNASAPQDLIALTNSFDLSDLEQRVFEGDLLSQTGFGARIALYTRLLNSELSAENIELPINTLAGSLPNSNATFFERVQHERPSGKPSSESTLQYIRSHRTLKATLAATLLISANCVATSEMMNSLSLGLSGVVNNDYNRYSDDHKVEEPTAGDGRVDPAYYAYRLYENDAMRTVLDAYMDVQVSVFKVQKVVDKTLASALPTMFHYERSNYKPNTFTLTGGTSSINSYSADGSMGYGDVNESASDRETKVYDIKALSSESSTGYWPTDDYTMFTSEKTNGSSMPPLEHGRLVVAGSSSSPDTAHSFEAAPSLQYGEKALFKVSTSRIRDDYGNLVDLHLPFKNGTTIGAARVVEADEKAPLHGIVVPVKLTSGTSRDLVRNVVTGLVTNHRLSEFSKPVLEYWLIKDDLNVQLATTTFHTFDVGGDGRLTMPIAETVRKALGVPTDASDNTILAKVSSKDYSYTPYASAGVASKSDVATSTLAQDIAAVASLTASLPSENCNTAALTVLAATGGTINGSPVNEAAGYRSDDGKSLTVGDSHTWLFNARGKIIDATPSHMADKPTSRNSLIQDSTPGVLRGLGMGALGALAGVAAFGQRRRIAKAARDVRTVPHQAELKVKARRFGRAITAIEGSLYSKPGAALPERMQPADVEAVSEKILKARFEETSEIAAQIKSDERISGRLQRDSLRLLEKYPQFTEAAERLKPTAKEPAVGELGL